VILFWSKAPIKYEFDVLDFFDVHTEPEYSNIDFRDKNERSRNFTRSRRNHNNLILLLLFAQNNHDDSLNVHKSDDDDDDVYSSVLRNDKGDIVATGIFATPYNHSRRDCNHFEAEIRSNATEITLHYYNNECENQFSPARPWHEKNTTHR
jgi:hypothetical protein